MILSKPHTCSVNQAMKGTSHNAAYVLQKWQGAFALSRSDGLRLKQPRDRGHRPIVRSEQRSRGYATSQLNRGVNLSQTAVHR